MIVTHPLHHPDDSANATESAPMHDTMQKPESTRRLNGWVILLVCVIITGAFAFSAESWIGLAEVTGFKSAADLGDVVLRLSWVLPIAVDGYLCLTTWLFLTAPPGSPLRRYSGWSVLIVVVLSIIAQGVYHGLDARGVDVAQVWPLVVSVGGIPPALLASSVHLLSVYLHHRAEPGAAHRLGQASPMTPPQPAPLTPSADSAEATRAEADFAAPSRPEAESPPRGMPAPVPAQAASPTAPRRLTVVGSRRRGSRSRREIDDATVADAIRDHVLNQRRLGLEPVQREMVRLVQQRTGVGVGQRRCITVAAAIRDDESAAESDDKESNRKAVAV